MRIGAFFLPTSDCYESPAGAYADIIDTAAVLDAKGWNAVWLAEHHFDGYGGMVPSPAVLASAIAVRTRRIRIGAAVAVVPFHHPLRLAEDFAMVDVISNGRLEMGIGRGFVPHELAAFGVDESERHARFEEGVRVLLAAWSQPSFTLSGKQVNVRDLTLLPRPIQRPTPPMWIAASTARESFELAGRLGCGLLVNPYTRTDLELSRGCSWYREAFARAGHDPAQLRILAHQHLYVADSAARAYHDPRAALERYVARLQSSFSRADPTRQIATPSYDVLFAKRVLFGTAAEVRDRIEAWRRFGITDLCLLLRFGDLPGALARESLERFNSLVLSRVQCES